jgi:hypothetical protein
MHPCQGPVLPRGSESSPGSDATQTRLAKRFLLFHQRDRLRRVDAAMSKAPIKVGVTGAAGQIAYSLLPNLVSGAVFGQDQPVILSLLDIPPAQTALAGVVMEM